MAGVKKNPTSNGATRSKRSRNVLIVLGLFLLVLAAIFAWNYNFIRGQLGIGTAYGARVACSCHYIGGRELADCEKDFEPGMEVISLSLDEENRRVTASVPLLASATAEFREGWGCVLLERNSEKAD